MFQRIADRLDSVEGIRPELPVATSLETGDEIFILQSDTRKLADVGLLASDFASARNIPRIESTGETIATEGIGHCYSTTGGMTIPANVFSAGDPVSIYNATSGSITLTQGTGLTLRLAGTGTTGDRTLGQRGLATLWFESTTEAIVIGAGVT